MTNQSLSLTAALGALGRRLMRMIEVARSRQGLAELDDAALHDLGISRAQARFEAARAPWDDGGVPPRRAATVLPWGAVRPS